MSNNNWGSSVWIFLHVLAGKINPKAYKLNTAYVFGVVKNICYNLPCPICSKHAINYLNRVSIDSIKDIDQFKIMLYNFHNIVNIKKGYKRAPIEVLNKYKNITIQETLWNLKSYYAKRYSYVLDFGFGTNDSKRIIIYNNTIDWITKFQHLFI